MMKPLIVKRGQTFTHKHFLDPEQLTHQPAAMVVTAVRNGVVYYTYDGNMLVSCPKCAAENIESAIKERLER